MNSIYEAGIGAAGGTAWLCSPCKPPVPSQDPCSGAVQGQRRAPSRAILS